MTVPSKPDPPDRHLYLARLLARFFGSVEGYRYASLGIAIGGLIIFQWAVVRFRLYDIGVGGTLVFIGLILAIFKSIRATR